MTLSVVIPCYNANIYIKEMLECCIRQSFKDWEVIVVDDGSTDNTLDLIKEVIDKESRIKLLLREREPKGADACRNIGMQNATGKYLIIFDADDLISDNCFENRVRFMEENEECDYASFPATYFSNDKGFKEVNEVKYGKPKGKKEPLYYLLNANYPFTVWSNIYRFSSLKGIEWDEKVMVYQDFDFMVSCALEGLKHKYCGNVECDYFYRSFSSGNNISSSFTSKAKCLSTLYLIKKTLDKVKTRNDYELCKKEFLGLILKHFERLIKAGNIEDIDEFLNLLSVYYSSKELKRFNKVVTATTGQMAKKNGDIILYYHLFKNFKRKSYFEWLSHSIIKCVIK